MSWRDKARAAITRAMREGRDMGLAGESLERHVRSRYPFGEREHHPYKIWLDEVRRHFPRKGQPIDLTGHPFLKMPC